jgi:DNA adenine methylase
MTVLKYPGAKNRIAHKIIGLFPDGYRNMTYVEPFFGSGAVFFRKAPSVVETVNDLDGDIYNLFLHIREHGEELARCITYTPWSREEYLLAYEKTGDALENARRFLVRSWMGIGMHYGKNCHGKYGWRHNVKNNSFNITTWGSMPDIILETARRLTPKTGNCVQIECRDAFELIERYSRKNILMYLDPPYVLNSRKAGKIYNIEMDDETHVRLCEMINQSPAQIILSGYANEIYRECLRGFRSVSVKTTDETGNIRYENVWTNFTTTGNLFEEEA